MKIVKIVSFCQIACLYIILTVRVVFGRSTEELKNGCISYEQKKRYLLPTRAYIMGKRYGSYRQRKRMRFWLCLKVLAEWCGMTLIIC